MKQAVFLVGGRGSRLGSLTDTLPKPLLPVGGRPFLDYLIETAVRHGLTDIILLCGYKADAIAARYAGSGPQGSTIRIVVEAAPAGTGGALHHAAAFLDPQFFLCNGDSFFGFDWSDLSRFSAEVGGSGAIALRESAPGRRSGTVTLRGDSIVAFHDPAENMAGPVNAGVYVLRRDVLDWVGDLPCSLEQDIFPRLAAAGRLSGKIYQGYFIDIGIPADYDRAQRELPHQLIV